jgi:hypothetical protein
MASLGSVIYLHALLLILLLYLGAIINTQIALRGAPFLQYGAVIEGLSNKYETIGGMGTCSDVWSCELLGCEMWARKNVTYVMIQPNLVKPKTCSLPSWKFAFSDNGFIAGESLWMLSISFLILHFVSVCVDRKYAMLSFRSVLLETAMQLCTLATTMIFLFMSLDKTFQPPIGNVLASFATLTWICFVSIKTLISCKKSLTRVGLERSNF